MDPNKQNSTDLPNPFWSKTQRPAIIKEPAIILGVTSLTFLVAGCFAGFAVDDIILKKGWVFDAMSSVVIGALGVAMIISACRRP